MRSTEAQLRLRRMSKLSLVRMVQSAKLVIVSTRKPSLTMAEFISNSAILTAVRPNAVLTAAYSSSPRHEKWQTSLATLPYQVEGQLGRVGLHYVTAAVRITASINKAGDPHGARPN